MQLSIESLNRGYDKARCGKVSPTHPERRKHPSIFQYDYLTLSRLSCDIRRLIAELPRAQNGARALDLGSGRSPYGSELAGRGYTVETLDLTRESGADHAGTAEDTGLPDAAYQVVLCTQVLEHCLNPWQALAEVRRILQPGGWLIASAPHVWFYHPHPTDHWRFTQEGMVRLCRGSGFTPLLLLGQGGSALTLFQVGAFLTYGLLGPIGRPVYALINLLGAAADRIAPNDLFCHNFACLARRD